jgi:hypothetical protein
VATGARQGQAERIIGLLKSCLEQALVGRRYSYGELTIMVAEAAQIFNEGVEQFWKKWMHLVFQEKLMSRAWMKEKIELTEGGLQKMMMRPIG